MSEITVIPLISSLTLNDLDGFIINSSGGLVINDIFSLEKIAKSTDLQTAIDASEVLVTQGTEVVDNIADVLIGIDDIKPRQWSWQCSRKGVQDATVFFNGVGGNSTYDTPFIAETDCYISKIILTAQSTTYPWSASIGFSSNFGSVWTYRPPFIVNGTQLEVFDEVTPGIPINLTEGDWVRVRMDWYTGPITSPSVALVVKES